MKKIYLLQHNTGEYEDSFTTTIAAYIDKDVRDKEIERLNNENDNLEDCRELWNTISDYLDNIEHPEYDKFWDEYNNTMEVPEEYDNYLYSDSFERFVYWMTKEMNDIFKEHDLQFWKDMFRYYIKDNGQYGPNNPGFYSGEECYLYEN